MVSGVNAHPASQQGVDREALGLRLTRAGFRVLAAVRSAWAVDLAARLFLTPRRHEPPMREQALMARSERRTLELEGDRKLVVRSWAPEGAPDDAPRALLTHGWEGRGTQLGEFVDPLLGAGWRVIAFDHLGHGESSGKRSSIVRMQEGLMAVDREFGPFDGLVAHSMGGAAAAFALDTGLRARRIAFVATPWDMHRYLERYAELVTGVEGLSGAVVRRLEEHYDIQAEDLRLEIIAPTRREPLLVVQDADDRDVPLSDGLALEAAWPNARLLETSGLGHRRILRDPTVVTAVVRHLTAG